jgi:hypothetical protein
VSSARVDIAARTSSSKPRGNQPPRNGVQEVASGSKQFVSRGRGATRGKDLVAVYVCTRSRRCVLYHQQPEPAKPRSPEPLFRKQKRFLESAAERAAGSSRKQNSPKGREPAAQKRVSRHRYVDPEVSRVPRWGGGCPLMGPADLHSRRQTNGSENRQPRATP